MRLDKLSPSIKWLFIPFSAIFLAILINTFIIVSAIVPSESMEGTISKGSLVVARRLAYSNTSPARGDIILFKHKELGKSLIIKRIIGLPGETVEIRSGRVYINEASCPLPEEYVSSFSSDDFGPVTVPQKSYFVLGDNRNSSNDSRIWTYTYVTEDEIRAKAESTLFPDFAHLEQPVYGE